MHLTEETLARLVDDVTAVETLRLVGAPPVSVVEPASLLRCGSLVSLQLSRLGLAKIEGRALAACPALWWVDLSFNRLETLRESGVDALAALGKLDVRRNKLAADGLDAAGDVEVLRLNVAGNPGARDALARVPRAYRPRRPRFVGSGSRRRRGRDAHRSSMHRGHAAAATRIVL